MPKSDTSRLDALEALIAEKRKHEGYLEKLEGRRASTPDAVYSRLRDEYLTKLTDLQVRAHAEAEVLTVNVREDEEAVAEIEARLSAATEERIEGELRAEVGEYDPKEWAKKLEVMNATINKIEREREARASVLERTRELLAEATGAPIAATPSRRMTPPPTPAAPPAPARRGTPQATVAPVATAASAPPAAGSGKAAEPARPSVMQKEPSKDAAKEASGEEPKAAPAPAATPAAAPSAPPAATPSKGAPIAGGPSFDELAFLNSVVGRTSTPVRVDPPAPVPRASKPVAEIKEGPAAHPASAKPAADSAPAEGPSGPSKARATKVQATDDAPASALGRPTPRSSQAIKTLKCQECGTLNYPTEWYCERCGGELAAL